MPVPVISIAQMREWENATWTAGQTEAEVIRRVGQAVARRALELTLPGERVLIVAGNGHNGSDARAAGKHLTGRQVEVLEVADSEAAFSKLETALSLRPALLVDGLFGIGLNRSLDPSWIRFIDRINAARAQVLAVDVPSGLNADTGGLGGAAVEAAVTLTVGGAEKGNARAGSLELCRPSGSGVGCRARSLSHRERTRVDIARGFCGVPAEAAGGGSQGGSRPSRDSLRQPGIPWGGGAGSPRRPARPAWTDFPVRSRTCLSSRRSPVAGRDGSPLENRPGPVLRIQRSFGRSRTCRARFARGVETVGGSIVDHV